MALALVSLTHASVFVVRTCLAWCGGFAQTFFGERAALFNQLDDFFNQGVLTESLLLIGLQSTRFVCKDIGELKDSFFCLGFCSHAGVYSKLSRPLTNPNVPTGCVKSQTCNLFGISGPLMISGRHSLQLDHPAKRGDHAHHRIKPHGRFARL